MSKGIDLTLLDKFVAELRAGLAAAKAVQEKPDGEPHDYLVELAKASGLAASVMQEAGMLVGDIQQTMRKVQGGAPSPGEDLLSQLFPPGGSGPLGGPFGGGNSN